MDRRKFISLLTLGCPATVVAEKLGLVDRIRSYFFAPKGGWGFYKVAPNVLTRSSIALQLEMLQQTIPTIYQNDLLLAALVELRYDPDFERSDGTFMGIDRNIRIPLLS